MGQTRIKITVHTVNLLGGGSTQSCVTLSQHGDGQLHTDPSNPENDYSEVFEGDDVTWSGVAHPVDPPNPSPIINITEIKIDTNTHPHPPHFGAPLLGGLIGEGRIITRAAENPMENPLYYTIHFNIEGMNEQFQLDPKIRVIVPHNPSTAV